MTPGKPRRSSANTAWDFDLFIDTGSIDASSAERVCRMLEEVVTELKSRRYTTEADRH